MSPPPFAPPSIRARMTLASLAPLVFVLLLVTVIVYYLINAWIVREAQERVRQDLQSARQVLLQEQERLRLGMRLIVQESDLAAAVAQGDLQRLRQRLSILGAGESLDLLRLLPPHQPMTAQVLAPEGQQLACAPLLLSGEELLAEDEGLAARARTPLHPPLAGGEVTTEDRGMFLGCSLPLFAADQRLLGTLQGGVLLNGNLQLVDRIKQTVFGDQRHGGTDLGSATIFLGERRVATTVRLRDGGRALGTRVSPEVAEAVLEQRQTWLDRARVIDEWYLTAYEPLLDRDGVALGALYVGLLERPYQELKERAALVLLALLLVGGALGYLLARYLAKRLTRPLRDLGRMAQRLAEGERKVLLPVRSGDEIGRLTDTFNSMATTLNAREEELSALNRSLEEKVVQRTSLLEEKSRQLIHAQEELLRSEKLAAIGSLAAGVAHEINNPAAIIRGNIEIMLDELPAGGTGREEAEEILKQTERISRITHGMLTFAREQMQHPAQVRINDLLEDILAQVSHQVPMAGVTVRRELDSGLPLLAADAERLRQLFTNLLLNALQAMGGSGQLTVRSRADREHIEVAVADSGPGIPAHLREKIFNPFFTTKSSGTGLGLSVSYGIVQSLGGSIEVDSAAGGGALFLVRLPVTSLYRS